MNTILSKFGKILSFAAVLAVISGNASATDLRDWGKKYSASQRFVVLSEFNNEAVLDKETQLVWPRTWSNAGSDWSGVSRSCANAGIGGRKGWRLPYLHELASLLDPAVTPTGNGGTKLPADHPFVNIVAQNGLGYLPYWTATWDKISILNAVNAASAQILTLDLATGSIVQQNPFGDYRFVCVRGAASQAESAG